jgi:hypothetical protein
MKVSVLCVKPFGSEYNITPPLLGKSQPQWTKDLRIKK